MQNKDKIKFIKFIRTETERLRLRVLDVDRLRRSLERGRFDLQKKNSC